MASPVELLAPSPKRWIWLLAFLAGLAWMVWHFIVSPYNVTWQLLAASAGLQLPAIIVVVYCCSVLIDASHEFRDKSVKHTGPVVKALFCLGFLVIGLWLGVPTLVKVNWSNHLHLPGQDFGLQRSSYQAALASGWITFVAWLLIFHETGTLLVWWQKRRPSRRARTSPADQTTSGVSQYI